MVEYNFTLPVSSIFLLFLATKQIINKKKTWNQTNNSKNDIMKRKGIISFSPITPLATLRTAQLFQMSWPLISSTVGIRMGSIWGFSASVELEESLVNSLPELLDIVPESTNLHKTEQSRWEQIYRFPNVGDNVQPERA